MSSFAEQSSAVQNTMDLIVYPNPATEKVSLRLGNQQSIEYRIINTIGQVVQNGKTVDATIHIEALKSGIYILEAKDGQKLHTTKLVKR